MKNCFLSFLLGALILSYSCNSSDKPETKSAPAATGNSDSAGSQPIQPDSAVGGNIPDSADRLNSAPPRADSIIKH